MATVSNITSLHRLFNRMNEMSYTLGIHSWKWGKSCYNWLADQNKLHNHDYKYFFYRTAVGYIVFLLRHTAFREHIPYAPAKKIDDFEEYMYREVISSDWWWNEQVHCLNCVTGMMTITASITTTASWSYDCPIIFQFRPDTFYNIFEQDEKMSSISLFRIHLLHNNIKMFDLCT